MEKSSKAMVNEVINTLSNGFSREVAMSVAGLVGCQFGTIGYSSEVKAPNKAQAALVGGSVMKIVRGEFQLNYSYENAVNNRAEKATGEKQYFESESLRWGQWLLENKLIEHKGELYVRFYGVKGAKVSTEYLVNGVAASTEQVAIIKSWEEKKLVGTQASVGLVENQVIARSIKLCNINYLKVGGIVLDRMNYGVVAM